MYSFMYNSASMGAYVVSPIHRSSMLTTLSRASDIVCKTLNSLTLCKCRFVFHPSFYSSRISLQQQVSHFGDVFVRHCSHARSLGSSLELGLSAPHVFLVRNSRGPCFQVEEPNRLVACLDEREGATEPFLTVPAATKR